MNVPDSWQGDITIYVRAATATKASKARALPKFWVTVKPISTSGADYAHHSTMGLVWLKFAVAPLYMVTICDRNQSKLTFTVCIV